MVNSICFRATVHLLKQLKDKFIGAEVVQEVLFDEVIALFVPFHCLCTLIAGSFDVGHIKVEKLNIGNLEKKIKRTC